jgi:acyl-coenzyme A thioesterase PaaI-like protein
MDDSRLDYEHLRREEHPNCVVCGKTLKYGLGLEFRTVEQGIVEATFACQRLLEGYPHVLHGGVICTVLDGAMTNCVFACGSAAMTGDLHVRFRKPVAASGMAIVRAWIEASSPPLYKLAARLVQDGEIKATAKARFVERNAAVRFAGGQVER